jgi:hypothetical protein
MSICGYADNFSAQKKNNSFKKGAPRGVKFPRTCENAFCLQMSNLQMDVAPQKIW